MIPPNFFQKLSQKYSTPLKVQKLLSQFSYNREAKGETLRSARSALKLKTVHCLEACFVAAAILEPHGYPPLVMSFESQDGLDHVIYIYQNAQRLWGSIARSRDEGLHGRRPVFKNVQALAKSYIDPYIDLWGRITAYQVVSLDQIKSNWRHSPRNVWQVEKYLIRIRHNKINCTEAHYQKLLKNYRAGQRLSPKSFWVK